MDPIRWHVLDLELIPHISVEQYEAWRIELDIREEEAYLSTELTCDRT